MILGTLEKQPNERADFDIDCRPWLTAYSDSISFVTAEIQDDDNTLSILSVTASAGFVKVWIDGGEHGRRYKVTATINSSGGRQVEAEVRVRVREV